MELVFENENKAPTYRDIKETILVNIPLLAIKSYLLYSLLLWTKPELIGFIKCLLLLETMYCVKLIFGLKTKHIRSIHIDTDKEALIITHYNFFDPSIETIFKGNTIKISEVRHMPVSSFSFYNFYTIQDHQSKVKIRSSAFKDEGSDFENIYTKLNKKYSS